MPPRPRSASPVRPVPPVFVERVPPRPLHPLDALAQRLAWTVTVLAAAVALAPGALQQVSPLLTSILGR